MKPWYVDVLTSVVVLAWMGWTFATIQQFGPSLNLILPAVVVLLVGVLLIYGQRLTYLRIGDSVVVGMDSPLTNGEGDDEHDRERGRRR
jgi:hypothetical protein